MAVRWQATGTGSATSAAWPSHTTGDIGVLLVETANQALDSLAGAGWTEFTGSPNGQGTAGGVDATRLTAYWKRAASGAEGNAALTSAGANHIWGVIITFRGCITSGDPVSVLDLSQQKTSATTSLSITGINTTEDDCEVLYVAARSQDIALARYSAESNGSLTSLTERYDAGTGTGNGGGIGAWTGIKTTAGATGTLTAVIASTCFECYMVLALKRADFEQDLTLPLLTNSNTLYPPFLSASGTPSLVLPLLTNTNTLYPPTLVPQAITVTLPLLTNSNTLYPPSVNYGYVLDVYNESVRAGFGLRKQRTAYTGSGIRVRRDNDDTELDIGFDVNGLLDTAALLTFVGANSGYVVTVYDQINSYDHSQPTEASQPRIVNAGVLETENGLPTMVFDGVDDYFILANTNILANCDGADAYAAVRYTDTTTQRRLYTATTNTSNVRFSFGIGAAAGKQFIQARRLDADAVQSANGFGHVSPLYLNVQTALMQYSWGGAYSRINTQYDIIDDPFTSAGNTTNGNSLSSCIGANNGTSDFFEGKLSELIIYNTYNPAATIFGVEADLIAYWGIQENRSIFDFFIPAASYALRRVIPFYTGNCIRIRRSSDDAEQDIGFSGDDLDTAAISSFVGANSAYIVTWYDQAGSARNATQATAANQPRIVNAGVLDSKDGFPAAYHSGAQEVVTASQVWTMYGTYGAAAVASLDNTTGIKNIVDMDTGGASVRMAQLIRANGAVAESIGFTGSTPYTDTGENITANALTIFSAYRSDSGLKPVEIFVNGVSGGGTNTTGLKNTSQPVGIGGSAGGSSQYHTGHILEAHVFFDTPLPFQADIDSELMEYYISLNLPLLTNTNTLYPPTLVASSTPTLVLPLLTNSNTLYPPTLVPQAVTITLPLLANTNTLYAPTLAPQAVNLTLPLLTNVNTLYAPTLQAGAASITLPLLANTNTLYPPTLAPQAVSITLPLLSNANTLYAPTLAPQAVNITLPLLVNTSALYAPELQAAGTGITLPVLANTGTLYAPTLVPQAVDITLPLLTNVNVLYAPTLAPQPVDITLPLLLNTSVLYAPSLGLTGGNLNVYIAGVWVNGTLKGYVGGTWQTGPIKRYESGSWL
jgi:hypothetical protein